LKRCAAPAPVVWQISQLQMKRFTVIIDQREIHNNVWRAVVCSMDNLGSEGNGIVHDFPFIIL